MATVLIRLFDMGAVEGVYNVDKTRFFAVFGTSSSYALGSTANLGSRTGDTAYIGRLAA